LDEILRGEGEKELERDSEVTGILNCEEREVKDGTLAVIGLSPDQFTVDICRQFMELLACNPREVLPWGIYRF